MSKHGFVYIWYDRKHKRYYIGCRFGRETDGYICSSRWMRNAYKRRPEDFKRRILATGITSKDALYEEEYRWLQMIKPEEVGVKYYNLQIWHYSHWSNIDTLKWKQINEERSIRLKGKSFSPATQFKPGASHSPKTQFVKGQTAHNKGTGKPIVTPQGMFGSVRECSENTGIPLQTIYRRLDSPRKTGWQYEANC